MAIYGYIRSSALRRGNSADAQAAELARKAGELGGCLVQVFVEPDSPTDKAAVLARPVGRAMLETLQAKDTLIVTHLDRLGYSMRDVQKTVGALWERGVRIYAIHARGRELNLDPTVAKAILAIFPLGAEIERALRSERFTELARWRKENGLAYGGVPTARKIVERDGVKHLEWDMEQLAIIAEIAYRVPREGAEKVAKDFWRRRIKDRRGRLWGQQTPQQRPVHQLLALLNGRHYSPYQQFYRAARWFHRMKRKGLLPAPYGPLADLWPDPKGFREEPGTRGWTPGGTERRQRQRAKLKAQHHAERLARWQAEKAARLRSRVHKPLLAKSGITPVLDPPAG